MQVPTTSTTDQKTQDASQAGPSCGNAPIPMDGPEADRSTAQARKEAIGLFHTRLMEFEKKLQQSNASESAAKPISSAAPLQGRPKRTASSDEAEKPPKRRLMAPVSGVMTEETSTAASESTPAERPSTSELVVQGDPISSPWWADIRTPEKPLPCIIQVNYLSRIGSFHEGMKDWTFLLSFDAGHQRGPAMIMKFFSSGVKGPQRAQTGWRLSGYMEDEWMVLDFSIHRVSDSNNRRIHYHRILEACQTDEEMARCMCIELEAWPKQLGHFDNPAKKDFAAIFTGRHPYQLHIRFLAPDDVETFEKQCLSFFTHFFEHRESVHSRIPKR